MSIVFLKQVDGKGAVFQFGGDLVREGVMDLVREEVIIETMCFTGNS